MMTEAPLLCEMVCARAAGCAASPPFISCRQNLMLVSLYRMMRLSRLTSLSLSLTAAVFRWWRETEGACSAYRAVKHDRARSARRTEYRQRQRLFSCFWHDLRRIRIAGRIPRSSMHLCSDARGLSVIFWRFDGLSSVKSPWGLHYWAAQSHLWWLSYVFVVIRWSLTSA